MSIVIENVTAETAYNASCIYALSWKYAYKGIVPQKYLDDIRLDSWVNRLNNPYYENYIMNDNGIYVAASSISLPRDKDMYGWGEIDSIYVHPNYYRKKYGKLLFEFVTSQLKEQAFENIYLWTLEDNKNARSFYDAMGLLPSGDKKTVNIGGKNLDEIRYVNQRCYLF